MNTTHLKLWSDELRSGKYLQGTGQLWTIEQAEDGPIEHACCLAVGCVAAGIPREGEQFVSVNHKFYSLPPAEFANWLDLDTPPGTTETTAVALSLDVPEWLQDPNGSTRYELAVLNDSGEFTFDQIADLIDYFGVRVVATTAL